MKIEKLPFDRTNSFSQLFLDYVSGKSELSNFYSAPPSKEGFKKVLEERDFPKATRNTLVDALQRQYEGLEVSDEIKANISLLKEENTFTITTGHQLNIFTGPLYFIYKIVTVINAVKQLKASYPEYNFVPVYWMATEDHDFEEISYFYLEGKKYHWNTDQTGPVGRFDTTSLQGLLKEINADLPFFPRAYGDFGKLADACRCYVSEIFSEEGIVVIDGDDRALKELFIPIIENEILDPVSKRLVTKRNDELNELGYSGQAFTRDINFFHISDNHRERLTRNEDGSFSVNGFDEKYSAEEIRAEIHQYPERFSPNVIMRPLYQETILPNLGYVGGPAEMAYWLQLKAVFDHYETSFPVLLPRSFGVFISKNVSRKIEKNGLSIDDLFTEELKLKRDVLERVGADYSLNGKMSSFESVWEQIETHASEIDPTLRESALAEKTRILKRIEHLQGKMRKAVERHNDDTMRQIESIKSTLFPGGSPQERHDNFLTYYFSNPNFIKEIIEAFDPFDLRFHLLWEG